MQKANHLIDNYSTALDAALGYAKNGWPVFPCKLNKKPLTDHGFHDATTNEKQIRAWWKRWPRASIATPTGEISGIFVIDPDNANGKQGDESLTTMQQRHGDLPITLTSRTGSGGHHLFFRHPGPGIKIGNKEGNIEKDLPDLDVRGDGGYIILPPSGHPSGNCYIWEHKAEIADIPDTYLALLMERPRATHDERGQQFTHAGDAGRYWLERALQQAFPGNRDHFCMWLICQLRDSGVAELEAESLTAEYASRCPAGDHPFSVEDAVKKVGKIYATPARPPARSQAARQGRLITENGAPTAAEQEEEDKPKETQAQALIRMAREATFFRSPDGSLYARVPVNNHYETWPLASKGGFRWWLGNRYHQETGSPPNTTALAQAIEWCEGEAQFCSAVHPVFTRVAEHRNAIYVDLGDEQWRAIEITAEGWHIVATPPVAFIRSKAMRALPEPVRGGSIDELRRFINIEDDSSWKLIVGWLIGAYHPRGPYPINCIHGERGAAKSSATRYLRGLVDPSAAPTRSAPKDDRDLAIAAHNSWTLALDNLSHIPTWLSDGLCRIATGAGFATRSLYEDATETVFQASRPIILNGIEELATRGDLLDRAIIVTLPAIPENVRTAEKLLDRAYEEARPRMLGALFDALVAALHNEPTVQLTELPRMADFARWVTAAESALGWKRGAFMTAYTENRASAVNIEMEASPLAQAIQAFMKDRSAAWTGTASELEEQLKSHKPSDEEGKYSSWPRNARALSGALKRIATALRSLGTAIKWVKASGERTIEISTIARDAKGTQNPSSGTQNSLLGTQNFRGASPTETASAQGNGPNRDAKDAKSPSSSTVAENEREEKKGYSRGAMEERRDFASFASSASLSAVCADVVPTFADGPHPQPPTGQPVPNVSAPVLFAGSPGRRLSEYEQRIQAKIDEGLGYIEAVRAVDEENRRRAQGGAA